MFVEAAATVAEFVDSSSPRGSSSSSSSLAFAARISALDLFVGETGVLLQETFHQSPRETPSISCKDVGVRVHGGEDLLLLHHRPPPNPLSFSLVLGAFSVRFSAVLCACLLVVDSWSSPWSIIQNTAAIRAPSPWFFDCFHALCLSSLLRFAVDERLIASGQEK